MAESYQNDIDFAFFAVNFHYSKADYEALTRREKLFIYKAWENKVVSDSSHIRNAVLNAIQNGFRKKNKKFIKLWKKGSTKADKEIVKNNMKIIRQAEKNDGDWISKIYEANNMKIPKRKKGGNRHG